MITSNIGIGHFGRTPFQATTIQPVPNALILWKLARQAYRTRFTLAILSNAQFFSLPAVYAGVGVNYTTFFEREDHKHTD